MTCDWWRSKNNNSNVVDDTPTTCFIWSLMWYIYIYNFFFEWKKCRIMEVNHILLAIIYHRIPILVYYLGANESHTTRTQIFWQGGWSAWPLDPHTEVIWSLMIDQIYPIRVIKKKKKKVYHIWPYGEQRWNCFLLYFFAPFMVVETIGNKMHEIWLDGRSPCSSIQKGIVRAITPVRPMWNTWYYPLLSHGVGSINPHQRPFFFFIQQKKKKRI